MELPQFAVRRFSVEEYHHLGAAGILTEDERVELLEGWIAPKTIHNPRHALGIEKVQQALLNAVPKSCRIRVQLPITTSDSEPEPDVAVVRGALRKHAAAHHGPEDVELLVEVAETSLALDRIDKARIYARAGIRVYWIVNLVDRQVEIYTDPSGPEANPHYGRQQIYSGGQSLPLVIDGQRITGVRARDVM